MRLQLALTLLISRCGADMIDQFARQGRALLAEAVIPGVQTRQCACTEQRECVEEMKVQALECVDQCWGKLSVITSNTQGLRDCFSRTDDLLEDLLACFEHNMDSCLEARDDKAMIQKINITEIFRLGADKIEKTKVQLTKTLSGPIRKIIDAASVFGLCVKDCFLAKNDEKGFCFERKECQPLLLDKKARKSLRQCSKLIDWKKEAGELCDCSVKAGLSDLQQYCPMLRLIGGSHRGGGAASNLTAAVAHGLSS